MTFLPLLLISNINTTVIQLSHVTSNP